MLGSSKAITTMKGASRSHDHPCNEKQPFLTFGYARSDPCNSLGSNGFSTSRNEFEHHQRTCSESVLLEEQPSWLDDPDMPARIGSHRRSSSHSSTYLNMSRCSYNSENQATIEYESIGPMSPSSWATQQRCYETRRPHQANKQDLCMSIPCNLKDASERSESTCAKHSKPELDEKRIKQQFAQRSRVRKLQYIAELERTVQALQAEGSDASAELQFLNQQNIFLSLENETLWRRLNSLAQEHLIKQFQQEVLEREIARLRSIYLQQPQQEHMFAHGRSVHSRDLDAQFTNLSLKHNEANLGKGSATTPLHI